MFEIVYNAFFEVTIFPWAFANATNDTSQKQFYKNRRDVIYLDNALRTKLAAANVVDFLRRKVVCHCNECKHDNVKRRFDDIFEPTESLLILLSNWPEFFFMSDLKNVFFSTSKFVKLLKKENFVGYRIAQVPCENVTLCSSNDYVIDMNKKRKIFSIDFNGNFYNPYVNIDFYVIKCCNCGYDRIRCIGGAEASKCPICGNADLFDFSNSIIPNKTADLISNESLLIDCNAINGIRKCIPVYANKWDGSDFMKDNYLVSGRVAKWLVENNIYPLCLIPYPCYVSDCNKEQRERIEDIRYHHPCAIPPIQ